MNEDFVPFELAVKLKEKGFDAPCYVATTIVMVEMIVLSCAVMATVILLTQKTHTESPLPPFRKS